MSRLAQKPIQRNKTADKPVSRQAPRPEEQKAARKPAFMQAKLAVSQPGDAQEREADQVAAEVSRSPRADVQRASLEPAITPEKRDESLAPKQAIQPAAAATRMAASEEELQTRLARQVEPAEQPTSDAGQTLDETIEARIAARQGQGDLMQEAVRQDMEAQFGRDLSNVHIHTDAEAAELCAQVGARAFTIGSDIFFAPGEYAPETEAGRELLAHEMTHVAQQGGGAQRLAREVAPDDMATSHKKKKTANANQALAELNRLDIPPVKARHLPLYQSLADNDLLKRIQGYKRGRPNQVDVWNKAIVIDEQKIRSRLKDNGLTNVPTASDTSFKLALGKEKRLKSCSIKQLQEDLKIPDWGRDGKKLGSGFQVDHIVELQVSGDHGTGTGNDIKNMELLDQPSNGSSGSAIRADIYKKVEDYLDCFEKPPKTGTFLKTHDLIFKEVRAHTKLDTGAKADDSSWWSVADIQEAEPLRLVKPAPPSDEEGTASEFLFLAGPGGIVAQRFTHKSDETTFKLQGAAQKSVAGLTIDTISIDSKAASGVGEVGSISATWDLPKNWKAVGSKVNIDLTGDGKYRGYASTLGKSQLDFDHLCPLELDDVYVDDGALVAEGLLTPSLPILRAPIRVSLRGQDLRFSLDYGAEDLALPLPGVSIDEAMVSVFYSTQVGFGVGGGLLFSIDRLGEGELKASFSEAQGMTLEGRFDFDSTLFDRATVKTWWRNGAMGAEGEIGIDQPDKVRGIRSANAKVDYENGQFAATGSVQPSIPGVQEATLNIAYAKEQGLTIGGNLQLAANPAIRSGSVEVSVNKRDDAWRVTASGSAQPAIPGIDSELAVQYDDGAFNATFNGAFQRGMLAGTVDVGVTNRGVGEDGQPSGEPEPGAPLIVYGGGSASVQIAPWLQGTAGVRFAPDGEVTVRGEIGLPGQIEIFPRKQIDKDIFSIDIPIPIVPGIFAEVGGSLSAHAGIGPGVIDQLQLGIEYNPAHEENTHVTGDGHVNVPADAGLRLAVHGGIGLGIPAASVSGGLEVGGELGIAGAAEAGVHIDWMPSQGLRIDAFGRLSAHPKFLFDVSGYVEVEALFFTIYEDRWQLASFEYGSDMTFGVNFPIRYREGEPFDISLDDVEFQTPEVSVSDILSGLVEQIT